MSLKNLNFENISKVLSLTPLECTEAHIKLLKTAYLVHTLR